MVVGKKEEKEEGRRRTSSSSSSRRRRRRKTNTKSSFIIPTKESNCPWERRERRSLGLIEAKRSASSSMKAIGVSLFTRFALQ